MRTVSQGNLDLVLAVAGKMCDSWLLVLSACAERLMCCAELKNNKCRSKKQENFFFFPNNSKKLNEGQFLIMGMLEHTFLWN